MSTPLKSAPLAKELPGESLIRPIGPSKDTGATQVHEPSRLRRNVPVESLRSMPPR